MFLSFLSGAQMVSVQVSRRIWYSFHKGWGWYCAAPITQSVWLQINIEIVQHALLLPSSNLHGLYQHYQKLTCMLLFFLFRFFEQRNLGVVESCCVRESAHVVPKSPSSVCISIVLAASCLALFARLLPAVPLVLTVNQICLLPSCEPYFCLKTLPFQKHIPLWSNIFCFITCTSDCERSPKEA